MSRHINIFKKCSGLNTKTDPVRLKFDYRTGVTELAACVNVDCSDDGRISRRTGYTATDRTEAWHSLFSCNSYALGVTGNALAVIEADMSYTAIRNVTQNLRMSFARDTDGEQDVIYYANGYETGRVINKLSYSWPLITPVGATTIKEFYPAPVGSLLEIYNSRMFIAEDNILWYSEPNTYHAYRLGANYFGFSSRIKLVKAVSGGLWVSDSESVYFLGGNIMPSRLEMPMQVKKCDSPAIENTAVKAPASRIGIDGLSGIVVVFATTAGICVGSEDGQLIDITAKKIDLPTGLSGAGHYIDGRYICTID